MTTFATAEDRVSVDVWSDVMCPFCYIGHTVLLQAVRRFEHPVEVRHHSYQLMPDLVEGSATPLNDLLERERGLPRTQAAAMNAAVAARAAEVGLSFDIDRAIATNTKPAHRLIHLASQQGRETQMVERLFRAYFSEGHNVSDYDVLADLATEVGLDRTEVLEALRSGAYTAEFEQDVRQAQSIGISGVPFFVLDGKYAVSGAQPADTFLQALQTAWTFKADQTDGTDQAEVAASVRR